MINIEQTINIQDLPQDSPSVTVYSEWNKNGGRTYTCKSIFWENEQLWVELARITISDEERILIPFPTLIKNWTKRT